MQSVNQIIQMTSWTSITLTKRRLEPLWSDEIAAAYIAPGKYSIWHHGTSSPLGL